MGNKDDGIDLSFWYKFKEQETKRMKKKKELEDEKELFDILHRNYVAARANKLQEENKKQAVIKNQKSKEQKRTKKHISKKRPNKIKKQRVMRIWVKRTAVAVLIAGASCGVIQEVKASKGAEYIVDKVNELYPTGRYHYWDISNPEEDISKTNGVSIRQFGNSVEDIKDFNYEESVELIKYINRVVKENGFLEEWTPVYIVEEWGTSRLADDLKGHDNISMFKTKIEAYDMMKQEEKEQKEGISR